MSTVAVNVLGSAAHRCLINQCRRHCCGSGAAGVYQTAELVEQLIRRSNSIVASMALKGPTLCCTTPLSGQHGTSAEVVESGSGFDVAVPDEPPVLGDDVAVPDVPGHDLDQSEIADASDPPPAKRQKRGKKHVPRDVQIWFLKWAKLMKDHHQYSKKRCLDIAKSSMSKWRSVAGGSSRFCS
eukprot:1592213-Amphidinium_carterae.1